MRVQPVQRRRGSLEPRPVRAVLLSLAIAALASGCASSRAASVRPVPAAASLAMAEAQAALRAGGDDAVERARSALESAVAAAPDWVAPRRALDEILRGDLRALEALAGYRETLERGEGDAATLYLAGRLEGREGVPRFERAIVLDPTLAWGWHGIAFRGESEDGIAPRTAAQRALELARDPWERTFFTANLARIEATAGRTEIAVQLLDRRALDPETSLEGRTALAVQAALVQLRAPRLRTVEVGTERALAALRELDPTDAEITELTTALDRAIPPCDPGRIVLALAARPGAARDRRRAEILLEKSPSPLALGLLERALAAEGAMTPRGSLLRTARFAAGDFQRATERWLEDLPDLARGEDGLPRDPRLARVVESVRALAGNAPAGGAQAGVAAPGEYHADALVDFCAALVDAGWLREARTVAARLGSVDLDRALELDARALAGITFLNSTRRILQTIDGARGRKRTSATAASAVRSDLRSDLPAEPAQAEVTLAPDSSPASKAPPIANFTSVRLDPPTTIDELLAALAPHAAAVRAFRGDDADLERTRKELLASPRRSYAGVAEVVHPGPTLSAEDEDEDLGAAGTPVGGLAALLAELGRFGIFGALSGDGPDGTILPVLVLEERSGEHLGVRWHGTVAWCEGADVPSRAGRAGARIAGAALHEGYWIDVDQVRNELTSWETLARDFRSSPERVRGALAVRGLAARAGEDGLRERTTASALLDESERVRLAVLRDRAAPGEVLGAIALDELIAVSSTHEEGHLCDRTRFLPLSRHWLRALGLLANAGFSPLRVQEDLEYRAQLTALASIADPRVALAQILDGVQGGFGATPHAAGYVRLLDDFLLLLDGEVQRGGFPQIASDRTLVHQLHALSAEDVRTVALLLAHKKRMVAK